MSVKPFISILVAEDNDVSRQLVSGILENSGYRVRGAIDGESAIKVIEDHEIHVAVVDVNMAPTGGLEFAKYLISKGLKIPTILVTADRSSDLLIKAGELSIAKVMQKPIEPDRLLQTVDRLLKRVGINSAPLAVEEHSPSYNPETLMKRVIDMAHENAQSGKGRPFAALISDESGKILSHGVNRYASRFDPTAHAEVMAIRKAAEALGQDSLENCTLYCSSRPTKIGDALIESVGITKVYYGLDHHDFPDQQKETKPADYEQINREEALKLFD